MNPNQCIIFGIGLIGIVVISAGWCAPAGVVNLNDDDDFTQDRLPWLAREEIANGWLALFDGDSLFGWRRETEVDWRVENGAISATTGQPGLLRTSLQFDDFRLRLEFKAHSETNSGVFVRTSPQPVDPRSDCFEINIAPPDNPFPTGSIVSWVKGATTGEFDTWNRMIIEAVGPRIRVWVNDQPTVDHDSGRQGLRRGYIGLQFNRGAIQFRNLAIQPLNMPTLSISEDLAEWRIKREPAGNFEVNGGATLRLRGGLGQIETRGHYADFIFSSHIRTHQSGVNSGVFFRCIPGEMMNGYESQIDNRFQLGCRDQPVDYGTGGIFRRQNARYLNADDQLWFAKTIITHGATVGVWVNGLQVCDWTDTRQPHENPRQGRRLQAGSVILQGHDQTTDVSFKSMRLREVSPRRPTIHPD